MICRSCRDGEHADCRGGTWCACQHRTDRQPAVLLGVAAPSSEVDLALAKAAELLTPMILGPLADEGFALGVAKPCNCTEQVDAVFGVMAVPPPVGCPAHGDKARWLRPVGQS